MPSAIDSDQMLLDLLKSNGDIFPHLHQFVKEKPVLTQVCNKYMMDRLSKLMKQSLIEANGDYSKSQLLLQVVQRVASYPEGQFGLKVLLVYGLTDMMNDAFCKALQTVRTKQNTKSTEKFMEEILETVVAIADHSPNAKGQMIDMFFSKFLGIILDDNVNFSTRIEALKGLNLLLENCPPAIREKLKKSNLHLSLIICLLKSYYEFQVGVTECLFRLTHKGDRSLFAKSWFAIKEQMQDFVNVKDLEFETDSRKFLNKINGKNLKTEKSIVSYPAISVKLGKFELHKPDDPAYEDFWIDFNCGSQRISFFCNQYFQMNQDCSGLWETCVIWSNNVDRYFIEESQCLKNVSLYLNCPGREVMNFIPATTESLITMQFSGDFDIYSPLRYIFGKEKYMKNDQVCLKKISQAMFPVYLNVKETSQSEPSLSLEKNVSTNHEKQAPSIENTSQKNVVRRKASVPCMAMTVPANVSVLWPSEKAYPPLQLEKTSTPTSKEKSQSADVPQSPASEGKVKKSNTENKEKTSHQTQSKNNNDAKNKRYTKVQSCSNPNGRTQVKVKDIIENKSHAERNDMEINVIPSSMPDEDIDTVKRSQASKKKHSTMLSETSNSKSAADESPPAEHLESGDMAELSSQDDGEIEKIKVKLSTANANIANYTKNRVKLVDSPALSTVTEESTQNSSKSDRHTAASKAAPQQKAAKQAEFKAPFQPIIENVSPIVSPEKEQKRKKTKSPNKRQSKSTVSTKATRQSNRIKKTEKEKEQENSPVSAKCNELDKSVPETRKPPRSRSKKLLFTPTSGHSSLLGQNSTNSSAKPKSNNVKVLFADKKESNAKKTKQPQPKKVANGTDKDPFTFTGEEESFPLRESQKKTTPQSKKANKSSNNFESRLNASSASFSMNNSLLNSSFKQPKFFKSRFKERQEKEKQDLGIIEQLSFSPIESNVQKNKRDKENESEPIKETRKKNKLSMDHDDDENGLINSKPDKRVKTKGKADKKDTRKECETAQEEDREAFITAASQASSQDGAEYLLHYSQPESLHELSQISEPDTTTEKVPKKKVKRNQSGKKDKEAFITVASQASSPDATEYLLHYSQPESLHDLSQISEPDTSTEKVPKKKMTRSQSGKRGRRQKKANSVFSETDDSTLAVDSRIEVSWLASQRKGKIRAEKTYAHIKENKNRPVLITADKENKPRKQQASPFQVIHKPKRNRTRKPKRLKEKPKVADITIYDEISQESLYYEHDVKKNLAPSWKKAAEEARTKRKATETTDYEEQLSPVSGVFSKHSFYGMGLPSPTSVDDLVIEDLDEMMPVPLMKTPSMQTKNASPKKTIFKPINFDLSVETFRDEDIEIDESPIISLGSPLLTQKSVSDESNDAMEKEEDNQLQEDVLGRFSHLFSHETKEEAEIEEILSDDDDGISQGVSSQNSAFTLMSNLNQSKYESEYDLSGDVESSDVENLLIREGPLKSGFVSLPRRKRVTRQVKEKILNNSHDSCSEESEDEEAHNSHNMFRPKKLFHDTDQEDCADDDNGNVDAQEIDEDNVEAPYSGVKSLIQSFGAEIQRNLLSKKQQLENFTQSAIRNTQKQVQSLWNKQRKDRHKLLVKHQDELKDEVNTLEKDITILNETETKTMNFLKQQHKVLQNCRDKQQQRLKRLKDMNEDFSDEFKELEDQQCEQQDYVNESLEKQINILQKKILQQSQQQQMMTVKRSLQAIFI